MSTTPNVVLPYASNDEELSASWRARVRLRWLPALLISIALLVAADVAAYYFIDMWAIPYAPQLVGIPAFACALIAMLIKLRGWRRWWIAFGASFLLLFAAYFLLRGETGAWTCAFVAVTILTISLCWNLAYQPPKHLILWSIIAAVIPALSTWCALDFCSLTPDSTTRYSIRHFASLGPALLFHRYFVLGVIWATVLWLDDQTILRKWRAGRILGVATLGFLITASGFYIVAGKHMLARRSLIHGGPFAPGLAYEYEVANGMTREQCWQALEETDWNLSLNPDWRGRAVYRVGRDYARLERLVIAHPVPQLMNMAEPFILAGNRTEALPATLRNELFSNLGSLEKLSEAFDAPQIAWAVYASFMRLRQIGDIERMVEDQDRQRIARLLRVDLSVVPQSDNRGKWMELLNAHAHGIRAPFSEAACRGADEIVNLYIVFHEDCEAIDRVLARRRAGAPGTKPFVTKGRRAVYSCEYLLLGDGRALEQWSGIRGPNLQRVDLKSELAAFHERVQQFLSHPENKP